MPPGIIPILARLRQDLAACLTPQAITAACRRGNHRWRQRVIELNDAGKEVDSDCFKAWFRSQYATRIRERRRGAKPEDFDRIGTEFHRWLRDVSDQIKLVASEDFFRFIDRDFGFYAKQYLRLMDASRRHVSGLEHV